MDICQMCDGFDVSTEVGVLHFINKPTKDDIISAIENIKLAKAEAEIIEDFIAEDGTVLAPSVELMRPFKDVV